ncbi:MAG: hypothetical protein PHF86_10295 [Candidatus Nanoarchaeia archaeon]|nr:hypothetical protein [Candidatus Nanoarchaeia archaeon]
MIKYIKNIFKNKKTDKFPKTSLYKDFVKIDLVLGGKLLVTIANLKENYIQTCIYGDTGEILAPITKNIYLKGMDLDAGMRQHNSIYVLSEQYNKIPKFMQIETIKKEDSKMSENLKDKQLTLKQKEDLKKLYEIQPLESISFNRYSSWLRVPGGWVYSYFQGMIFVPYDNEFAFLTQENKNIN